MKKYIPIALALGIVISPISLNNTAYSQYEYSSEADFTKYYDKGIELYNKSEYSRAIEQFEQALKLAPENPSIRNNLAVSFISRGIYFHNNVKNYDKASENYLDAIYYLKYDAPENIKESPNASGNLDIATKNLFAALQNSGVDPNNSSYHFKKAQELRAKGMFKGAIVEYYLGLKKSPDNTQAYEAIGDMYRVLQNNERAAKAYQNATKDNNNNPDLYLKTGLAYEKANDINAAIQAYNQASTLDPKNLDVLNALQKIWESQIKLNPRNAAAHANLGTILQKKGDFDGALSEYNTAELIDPNNVTVRLNLGTLYQAKGDIKTAIRAYDTILQVEPKNILALYYKATALKQTKNFNASKEVLKQILKIDPDNQMAQNEIIALTKEAGPKNGTDLLELLKEAANKNPNNAKAQYDAGYEAHSQGRINEAIEYYKKAIELDPNMTDAYSNIGAALISQKEYTEALKMLNKAAELNPSNSKVKELIAQIKESESSNRYQQALKLHQEGKLEDAIKIYEEALKSSPDNAEIYTNLGAAYQSLKEYNKALINYNKAVQLEPKSAISYYYLGTTYHAINKIDEAMINYNKALNLDPNNEQYKDAIQSAESSEVDEQLSSALDSYNKKEYTKAKAIIESIIEKNDNNALAYYYLGIILEAEKKPGLAISNYKKAISLEPNMENAYYALGVALDKVNNKSEAKEAFKKFIQLSGNKDDALVKYAEQRLKDL